MMRLPNFSRNNLLQLSAAIISGVLLVLSFPRFEWSFLAWVALTPLLFVLTQNDLTLKKSFGFGFLMGWVFFFFSANWISHSMTRYGGMHVVLAYGAALLFTAVTAIFPGLFSLVLSRLIKIFGIKAVGFAPLVWAATEWLRGFTTDITWNALGISQVSLPAIVRYTQIGGTSLISAVVVAVSAFLILLVQLKSAGIKRVVVIYIFIALLAALMPFLSEHPQYYFLPPITGISAEIKVAGIQPNLSVDILTHADQLTQRNESGLEINTKLTRDAINQTEPKKADVIVWAESPLVLNYEQDEAAKNRLNEIAKEHKAYLIFSAIGREGEAVFNSAQTITPDGRALKRYDKIRLLPFGEYVPFRFVLGNFVPAMVGDFTPGTTAVVNTLKLAPQQSLIQNEKETQGELALERTTNFAKVGTFICYEAAYPNLVRKFVNNGAGFLINISDDAWFGNSAGAAQHLNHARMRAIENDRDIVRVTNSGISALIKADGKIVDALPGFAAASKVWTVEENKSITVYTKYGDWFAYLSLVVTVLALAFGFTRKV